MPALLTLGQNRKNQLLSRSRHHQSRLFSWPRSTARTWNASNGVRRKATKITPIRRKASRWSRVRIAAQVGARRRTERNASRSTVKDARSGAVSSAARAARFERCLDEMRYVQIGFAIDGTKEISMRHFFWSIKASRGPNVEKRIRCVACDLEGKRPPVGTLEVDGRLHAECSRCRARERIKQ